MPSDSPPRGPPGGPRGRRSAIAVEKDSFKLGSPPSPSPSPEEGRPGCGEPETEPPDSKREPPTAALGTRRSQRRRRVPCCGRDIQIYFPAIEQQGRLPSGLSPAPRNAPSLEEGRAGSGLSRLGPVLLPSASSLRCRNAAERGRGGQRAARSPGRLPGDLGTRRHHTAGGDDSAQPKKRSGFLRYLRQGEINSLRSYSCISAV